MFNIVDELCVMTRLKCCLCKVLSQSTDTTGLDNLFDSTRDCVLLLWALAKNECFSRFRNCFEMFLTSILQLVILPRPTRSIPIKSLSTTYLMLLAKLCPVHHHHHRSWDVRRCAGLNRYVSCKFL